MRAASGILNCHRELDDDKALFTVCHPLIRGLTQNHYGGTGDQNCL